VLVERLTELAARKNQGILTDAQVAAQNAKDLGS